jgi:hypothetical protein
VRGNKVRFDGGEFGLGEGSSGHVPRWEPPTHDRPIEWPFSRGIGQLPS